MVSNTKLEKPRFSPLMYLPRRFTFMMGLDWQNRVFLILNRRGRY